MASKEEYLEKMAKMVVEEEEEYFISDLLICSDAMYNGIDVLKEKIESYGENNLATAVIGVVEGDTHDIGKNLVKLMLEVNGFKMIDLGKDVPAEKFVDEAIKNKAQFIMMSTLMTTTMANMKKVIDILNERNIRDQFIVMVGGGPVSESFAKDIGADAYSENANEAVKVAKSLIENHEN